MSTSITSRTTSDADAPIVGFLTHVRSSVAQLRLYPRDSAQVLKVCTTAFQAFLTALAEQESITLNRTAQGLLVNGLRLSGSATGVASLEQGMTKLLSDSGIKSATFRRGLALDELITFLHALTHKFWDVKEGKDINLRLRNERVTRISVDEVEYVALGQGDIVIKDAARRLALAQSRVTEVMKTLEGLVEGAVDEGTAAEVRLQVMKKLLEHDPTLLERASSADAPVGTFEAPSPNTGRLDFDVARQAIGDVARLMQVVEGEARERLRAVGDAIVGAFRHSTRLHGMMRQFLRESASDLLPGWLREAEDDRPKEPAAIARARTVLTLEPDAQIAAIAREGASLAKELEALGRPDLVAGLLGALVGFVRDRAALRRSAACDAIGETKGAIESEAAAEVRGRLEEAIRAALDVEEDPAIYPKLATVATMLVDARIRQGVLPAAMPTLDLLRRHTQVKEGGFPRRSEQAFQALERVASGGGFAVVQERLREGDPDALRVVESLDAAATRFLIGQIKAAEAIADRVRYAETIARAGASAAAILIEATQKTTAPSDALRLMEVLPSAAPEKMVEVALDGLLRHPAIALRRRAALMLAERGYPRAGSMILGALREETDAAVRATLVEALGDLRYKDAVEVLLELAEGRAEADEVRSEACVALGRIADRAAISILARLSSGGGGSLTKFFRPVVREIRVAATRALGSFPTDLTARETLRRLLTDALPSVRAAAQEAQESPLLAVPSARSATRDPRAQTWKLAGSLAEVPLDQICQLVASAQKTGLLTLHFDGRKARVFFEEGVVVAAEFEGRRDQAAFDAFCRRQGGHFSFRPNEAAPERRMKAPVAQCLLEAFRVADEAARGGSAPNSNSNRQLQ